MFERWWRQKWVRRFRRERAAVVASTVVGLYVLIGLVMSLDAVVTPADIANRVGPNNAPGTLLPYSAEERLDTAEYWLQTLENAAQARDAEERLRELQIGYMRPISESPDHILAVVRRGWQAFQAAASADWDSEEGQRHFAELEAIVDELWPPPTGIRGWQRQFEMCLGTDMQGRSISLRALYSVGIALRVGGITALIAVAVGSLLGTAAGFFGGVVDHIVTWLYTSLSSVPSIILLMLLAYMFQNTAAEDSLLPLYIAFSATYWIGPCRTIRGETMKLREMEYVQAARAVGLSDWYVVLRHVLPNTMHLMLVNASLLFVAAIKGEVILTYLGLGLRSGTSWGIMIDQSRSEVLNGFLWQIGAATALMFGLVLAFNVLSDALQDVLDPKHTQG